MNSRFKDYLKKFSSAKGDETMLNDLCKEMEDAVPEIVESIRQREELAAELRIAASKPSRTSQKDKE